MLACTKSNKAMVELLIKKGALVLLRNKDGWNSFHLACRYVAALTYGRKDINFGYYSMAS